MSVPPRTPTSAPAVSRAPRSAAVARWVRLALGVVGLVVLGAIVRHLGTERILATLRPALAWLPVLCLLELARIGCETLSSYLAYASLAPRIPRLTLFRANLVAHSIASLAPAPRVVNETIKVALLAPFVGVPAATSVGFINQAATLLAAGIFSVPCGAAVFALTGASIWFWTLAAHAVVLTASGLALQAVTRADAPGRWLVKRFPRFAERAAAFREHAIETGLWARGPTAALTLSRGVQVLQYWIAARAVGIDAGILRALAAQGVNLVASAVGVLVPAGLGTTDGAFTLAADMLSTTAVRATSLALLMRCVQLVWLAIGSAVSLLGPRKTAEDAAAS